ncbi:hypothetical protein Vadar_025610 [Vaccinium darrowii]|uniref:Uncharacterized protein n=1 Tax=Vaccinium darrowii TaxID=229202 RepID=A0ACB7XU09_9ERIC|nr:hypothetical protein Vadar_025610 [Vaccinium darrowii]
MEGSHLRFPFLPGPDLQNGEEGRKLMVKTGLCFKESSAEMEVNYDRKEGLTAFDVSKAGVKGLTDDGVAKVPKIFVRPPYELAEESKSCKSNLQVPVIDLSAIDGSDSREKVVNEVRIAANEWGFFQVVNHGIPLNVLDEMIDGVRRFHEQDPEMKKSMYTRDPKKRVRFGSNYDLYASKSANWRDTLSISLPASDQLDPDEIPITCRATTIEYIKYVTNLGNTLFELLSEALELKHDHLNTLECGKSRALVCHYYPACPEPELTLGFSKHTDPVFLTVLLQDQLGGLQVMFNNQWVNVQPISGGLVVNIGDLLQVISNDKFKSVVHRAVANLAGPRISVACFLKGVIVPPKLYGPIKELISEESPPVFKDFVVSDYMEKFFSKAFDKSSLDYLRLQS